MDDASILAKALTAYIEEQMRICYSSMQYAGSFGNNEDFITESSDLEGRIRAYQDILEVIPGMITDYVSG